MMRSILSRRSVVHGLVLGAAAFIARPAVAQGSPRVVVVGGGFGGVTCARTLQRSTIAVTLVEPNATYTACPFSNAVLAGLRPLQAQQFGYEAVRRDGVAVVQQSATGIDPQGRRRTG